MSARITTSGVRESRGTSSSGLAAQSRSGPASVAAIQRRTAYGEAVDVERHEPAVEIKGATLTALQVAQGADGWRAQCVVDVQPFDCAQGYPELVDG